MVLSVIISIHWLLANHRVREVFRSGMSSDLNRTAVVAVVVGGTICRYRSVALKACQFPLINFFVCLIVVVVVLLSHVEWSKTKWPKRAVIIM